MYAVTRQFVSYTPTTVCTVLTFFFLDYAEFTCFCTAQSQVISSLHRKVFPYSLMLIHSIACLGSCVVRFCIYILDSTVKLGKQ